MGAYGLPHGALKSAGRQLSAPARRLFGAPAQGTTGKALALKLRPFGCRTATDVDWVTSVDETDARRAVASVGPTSGQRRRLRRNSTMLRHPVDSANSAEKALVHA